MCDQRRSVATDRFPSESGAPSEIRMGSVTITEDSWADLSEDARIERMSAQVSPSVERSSPTHSRERSRHARRGEEGRCVGIGIGNAQWYFYIKCNKKRNCFFLTFLLPSSKKLLILRNNEILSILFIISFFLFDYDPLY